MNITENIEIIRSRIADAAVKSGRTASDITLVAATKMNDAASVRAAVSAGIDACGENRVQEMLEKYEQSAYTGAPLHFIGHLQKNKVKYIVDKVDLIQSVNSAELAELIAKRAQLLGKTQDILLEINIGDEDNKTGMAMAELERTLEVCASLSSIYVRGLMTIPPFSTENAKNRANFAKMHELFVDIKAKTYNNNISMDILSMGMSGDYADAILEGATMVRVGSAIFGERLY